MRDLWLLCLVVIFNLASVTTVYASGSVTGSFTTFDNVPPAKITDLAVIATSANSITLMWTAPDDKGHSGSAAQYDMRYSTSSIANEAAWASGAPVNGLSSPKMHGSIQTFTKNGLSHSTTYWFALKAADGAGNWSQLSNCVSGRTEEYTHYSGGSSLSEKESKGGKSVILPQIRIVIDGAVFVKNLDIDMRMLEGGECGSKDGAIILAFGKGTAILDKEGNPASSINVAPTVPSGTHPDGFRILNAYYSQSLCTFEPSILLNMQYDPGKLGENISENDLFIAYYDQNQSRWIPLPSAVDTRWHSVSASISQLSIFGLLAPEEQSVVTTVPQTQYSPAELYYDYDWFPELASPHLTIADISLSSSQISADQGLVVTARVINAGGMAGVFDVPVSIDGLPVASERIYLEAGQEKSLIFDLGLLGAGTHEISIGSMARKFTVVSAVKPNEPNTDNYSWLSYLSLCVMMIGTALMTVLALVERRRRIKRLSTSESSS